MPDRTCPTCETPVPEDAGFCPTCGEATPTQISDETVPTGERFIDSDELEYKHRLARALGDDYELRDLIGRGGFGSVYAAWDRKLDRDVAVKALRHDLFPTPMILQRFEREAKAVAKLRHPNILPIYTIGEGQGIAYMVMPLVDGESLRSLMEREGKLPTKEAIRITVETARALQAAHKHGFIHRDVKPENIMLDGEERHVLLMDFGIAKVATGDETGLTGTGVIIGSPTYMSPEQARGERDVDHRADIYALGAVAFEMLSANRPYNASNIQELIYQHLTTEPTDLRTVVPDIPEPVNDVIMGCLAKERDERIDSATHVVQRFEHASATPGVAKKVADAMEGSGVGTKLVFPVLLLVYITTGISWLDQVAAAVSDTEEGRGFRLAVDLLLPIQIIVNLVIASAALLLLWNISTLYRTHRKVGRALALSFTLPSEGAFYLMFSIMGVLVMIPLIFIIPTLQAMMASAQMTLPLSARIVIELSNLMQRWLWIPGLGLLVWFAWYRRSRYALYFAVGWVILLVTSVLF